MNLDDVFLQIANEMKISTDEVKKQIVDCALQSKGAKDISSRHFFSRFSNGSELRAEDVVMHIVEMLMKKM